MARRTYFLGSSRNNVLTKKGGENNMLKELAVPGHVNSFATYWHFVSQLVKSISHVFWKGTAGGYRTIVAYH